VLLKDMENPKARHRKGRALMGLGGVHKYISYFYI